MFDFNNVIENNNSDNTINNIQLDLLDIKVVFFNCYKLLIKTELQDNNWYAITNLVRSFDQTENNGLITHGIFESLLDVEFKYTHMLKDNTDEVVHVYTSKYFIVHVIENIFKRAPSKTLIKLNDNIDIKDLIMLIDISDYNNALNDIKRPGCIDIMSYVRFMHIMNYGRDYTIGDNILDPMFDEYCINVLNNEQEFYRHSVFYMDKTNKKFYFILPLDQISYPSAAMFTSLIDYSSAWRLINNNLTKRNTDSETFVIYPLIDPFYIDTKYDKRQIKITITDNVDNTTIPDYILRRYVSLKDIKKTKTWSNSYRIIMVEPC